ncbi:MAG TPA: anaerobic ribonucleoside-triphosphate reductase [Elusimicrobia bacterium]|nr:MAG: anaerobic ribonucleoside-triphosphate reductase [Elusimicrobia bacterium RIFOXYD2_FULL_34_30]HAM38708.1 anaerobic ribonucleoside-triphosphate reductase [Elusimicrobiota bacterium]
MKSWFSYVKKEDNRLEAFDESKIIASVTRASREGGSENKETINKIVRDILKILRGSYLPGETIITQAVSDAIEKALIEGRFESTFHAYQRRRIEKSEIRKRLKVAKRKEKADSTDLSLLVQAEVEEETSFWDKTKIADALVKEAKISHSDARQIACNVEKRVISAGVNKITTSLLRELVDNELLVLGYSSKIKKQASIGIPTYNLEEIIFSKGKENSNIAEHNPEAINLAIAEITLKQYALNNIFSRDVADAHLEGRIHIHDLGYPTRVYCSSHSLEYIKKYGLQLENLEIISSPAKHARTLTGHLNTFLASMQAYYAGALGVGYLNIFYAPYLVDSSYEEMIQEAQYLIFSLSQSAFSRGGQVLFLDANIHTGIPAYLKNVPAIGPGGKYTGRTYADYEKQAQMFAMALLDVWRKGDKYGHVFAFPKCDLHVNEESFSDPRQREILDYACLVASENGTPYFVFDRDAVTLSACCRLRTKITDNYMIEHPESMRFCGFQNVTINLPQAAYRAGRGNIDKLFEEIAYDMDLSIKAHLQKKIFIKKLMADKNMPLYQLGKSALDERPYVDLENSTYIMGMLGLNECVQHLVGRQLHENDEVFKLGLKIVSYMYLRTKEYEKKYNLRFALEESPAESAARRMAKVDLQRFPQAKEVIKGDINKDEYYYTNSIHFAANAPIGLIDRIIKQSQYHTLIESGAIVHAFIGEEKPQPSSIFNLIEKTWRNTKCAQITISPEFTVCNDCHRMIRGIKSDCARCGSDSVYGITRIVGYYSRISNWNKSKKGELKDRHKGEYKVEENNAGESITVTEKHKTSPISA